ncbi:glycosyltransferase [Flaviflexus huanghaiensis]|uniref:glycosyltransferase n=1 Tax=Flaviflexus huanghaiensis TaxID=1111473 RepID=UPI0015FAF343|nr:glycosyltransferase [Flaviflexus huanghaiensis]
MKFLQINAVNTIGSTGRTTAELSDGLKDRGHKCLTIHSQGPVSTESVRVGSLRDIKTHALLARVTGLQGYWSENETSKILTMINEFQPDVVRLGNIHANFVNLPMLLGYLAEKDIPTIATLHDTWFYTGKCTHYSQAGCSRWQESCGQCPLLKQSIPSWFFDRTATMRADKSEWFSAIPRLGVVGVSNWITSEAQKSLLSTAKTVIRIYNWVDLETFKFRESDLRERYGWGDEFLLLGVASGWSVAKGLKDALALASVLPGGMRLVLVGELPSGTVLPETVTHLPATRNTIDLAEIYSAADAFMNFSREESFGKVSAEALACGTPVITNGFTANPELVGPGCGYVAQTPDSTSLIALAEKVRLAGRGSFSEACRKFAVDNFSMESGISAYELLSKSLIAL